MKDYNVAIVGATGLVGQEFIKTLVQRNFPMASVRLMASDRVLMRFSKRKSSSRFIRSSSTAKFNISFFVGILNV